MKAGREDLIGFDKKCLIRPRNVGKTIRGTTSNPNRRKNVKTEKPVKKSTIRNVHKKKTK